MENEFIKPLFIVLIKACKKPLEVGIILDGSGSVGSTNWRYALSYVKAFAAEFNVSADGAHFGVIDYSSSARLHFKLSDSRYWDKSAFDAKIDSLPFVGGKSRYVFDLKCL